MRSPCLTTRFREPNRASKAIFRCYIKPNSLWFNELIWHTPGETPLNETLSFMTGLGGLLQLVLMGFAGIRIHDDYLEVTPCVPAKVGVLTVHGLHYGGTAFDLSINQGQDRITNAADPVNVVIRS